MYLKGLVPKDKEDENEEKEKSNKDREETEDVEKTEGREEEKAIVSMYLKGLVPKDKEDESEEKEKSNKVREEETEDVEKTEGREEEKAIVSSMRGNFDIRPIDFFGILTHMIHQSNDGPCALIAVCNVLLLKGNIYFERHETVVSVEFLLDLVSCLLKQSPKMQVYCAEEQTKIWDVVPTLAAGFDMDVIFARTDGFTRTPEWLLLDCLDLNIRHGWIARNFGPRASFERLTLAANEPGFQDAEMVKNFLRGHQLTTVGLISLHEDLLEKVPYILYWNHHYNTVVKVDGVLHTLATSSNYLRTPVVWQTLDDVNGAGRYLDTNFSPIYPGLDAALLGSNIDAESTSRASTSTVNPDPEGDTPHGDGFCLDHIITPQISGPDAALLRMNLHGRHFVRSSTYSVRPISEPHDTGPRVDFDILEITLEEFVKIPGNGFAELRIIFADGTSMDVADTTKIGRVLGLDILEAIIFAHDAGFSWDGCFDLSTIFVIDGVRAEIRAPYCDNCTEDAKANDLLSYVRWIIELFKVNGVLPAFFRHLESMLKKPPRRPPLCNDRELEDFQQELYGYWDQVLTTLALRSSLARGGLFSGIHRIRRLAPAGVRDTLRVVLTSFQVRDDWRVPIGDTGHPVLKKVLRYIPGLEDGSNENAKDEEAMNRKYGTFQPDVGSLSMFPRQVNEHGNEHAKSKEDVKLQQGMVEQEKEQEQEPFKKLSELDLLTSHYLQDRLPIVLEALLTSPNMTVELWEWLKEVLEDYARPEVLGRGTWSLRSRVFRNQGRGTWLRRRGCLFNRSGRRSETLNQRRRGTWSQWNQSLRGRGRGTWNQSLRGRGSGTRNQSRRAF